MRTSVTDFSINNLNSKIMEQRRRNLLMHQIVNIILARTAVTDMRCIIEFELVGIQKKELAITVKTGDLLLCHNSYDTIKRMRKETFETYIDELVTNYYKEKKKL